MEAGMALKIFESMCAKMLGRRLEPTRFCSIDVADDSQANVVTCNYDRIISVTISVRDVVQDAGEEDMQRAVDLISREVYGELLDDAFELNRILHNEFYRGIDDKAANIVINMINKMRGK
jgi:hypothetical protein